VFQSRELMVEVLPEGALRLSPDTCRISATEPPPKGRTHCGQGSQKPCQDPPGPPKHRPGPDGPACGSPSREDDGRGPQRARGGSFLDSLDLLKRELRARIAAEGVSDSRGRGSLPHPRTPGRRRHGDRLPG
jgi:hypothetical protein